MMSRSRKRQRSNSKVMLATNDLMGDLEGLKKNIGDDMDFYIKRYKAVGQTFDLLEVVKMIATKHATESYSKALSDAYYVDLDPSRIGDLMVKSSNKSLLLSNMIRLEVF